MAYKASSQEKFHLNFSSRIQTDSNTSIRTTGIAANLESLYLFNGENRERPAVIPNLKQNWHYIDMTWNGPGYLMGTGGIKFADNGNNVLNTFGTVQNIDSAWATSKQGKSRVFVLNLEWKSQSIGQCYIVDAFGFRFFRNTTGTVFTVAIENQSGHRITWVVDTAAFRDGDPVTIVAMADMRAGNNTSRCYLNGVDLGTGSTTGNPFSTSTPVAIGYFGRTSSWNNYYGFDGKIGLFGHSFEFTSNIPPSLADLKALSVDPYRTLLNTQRSQVDFPDILLPVASDWEIEFEARIGPLPTDDNVLLPVLVASPSAPNRAKCLNLAAAGDRAYITIPAWTRQYGSLATWAIEVDFELTRLDSPVFLLFSDSTGRALLKVNVEGSITIDVGTSAPSTPSTDAGIIKLYTRYKAKLMTRAGFTGNADLYINDVLVGSSSYTTLASAAVNSLSAQNSPGYNMPTSFILYSLKLTNSGGEGTGTSYYSAEWNSATMPTDDLSLTWPSVGSTHNITITSPTVAIDPYYTKTPFLAGFFTDSSGRLIYSECVGKIDPGGFAASSLWGGGGAASPSWQLSNPWSGFNAASWYVEVEFIILSSGVTASPWTFTILGNSMSSSLIVCTVNSAQTAFTIEMRSAGGTVIVSATDIPFVIEKWYKIKAEATGTDWVIWVNGIEVVPRVPSTANTSLQTYMFGLDTFLTPYVRVAFKSVTFFGASSQYQATWNTTTATGKGNTWVSTNGLQSLTSNSFNPELLPYFWYDITGRRYLSEPGVIIPNERHIYKISRSAGNTTILRDYNVPFANAWTMSNNLYINRMASVSLNGREYGNNIHLFSLRAGSETWTPNSSVVASSVNSGRNATSSGTSFINIPNTYVYCPTNGQTYANFAAIPTAVVNLTNVVFEISGFVRDTASIRFAQTPATSVTVKATAGQEFIGKMYDDAVATAMFCNTSTDLGGLACSTTAARTLYVSDVILTSNQVTSSGSMFGVVGTASGGSLQTLHLSNVGILSNYEMANSIHYNGTGNIVTINNVITVGASNSGGATVTANRFTAINTHPTNTIAPAISDNPTITSSIAISPIQSSSKAVSGTITNVATNDGSGSYGMFASLNDFIDPSNGDYRLKTSGGFYKSGIGAFSANYSSPVITPYTHLVQGVLSVAPFTTSPGTYFIFPVPEGVLLKRWDGTTWQPVALKRWNGTTWEAVGLKRWDGTTW